MYAYTRYHSLCPFISNGWNYSAFVSRECFSNSFMYMGKYSVCAAYMHSHAQEPIIVVMGGTRAFPCTGARECGVSVALVHSSVCDQQGKTVCPSITVFLIPLRLFSPWNRSWLASQQTPAALVSLPPQRWGNRCTLSPAQRVPCGHGSEPRSSQLCSKHSWPLCHLFM